MNNLKVISLVILSILIACSRYPGNPEAVIVAFYKAANECRYQEAKQYLSQESIRHVDGPFGTSVGRWKRTIDRLTKSGRLEKVEVIDVNIRGDGASCKVKTYFKDKEYPHEYSAELVKEDGKWKISAELDD